ncbi:MAG: hypothetical protein ACO1SX_18010 [Actinomycetota bacterium]
MFGFFNALSTWRKNAYYMSDEVVVTGQRLGAALPSDGEVLKRLLDLNLTKAAYPVTIGDHSGILVSQLSLLQCPSFGLFPFQANNKRPPVWQADLWQLVLH